jgi:K+-transporting ATPase KdpF subunit
MGMGTQVKEAVRDKDLILAFISAVVASFLLGIIATKPSLLHLILALIGVGAIIAAYLFVARSVVDERAKAAAAVGTGIVSLLCLLAVLTTVANKPPAEPHALAAQEHVMIFDYVLGGATVLALLCYLVYALLRPERF